MKKLITFIAILFSLLAQAQAPTLNQYGTRTPKLEPYPTSAKSIDVNSGLSVNSTTAGFVPPRMTTTQKLAISSPVTGTLVFDTNLGKYQMFNGTSWVLIDSTVIPTLQQVCDTGNTTFDTPIILSNSTTGSYTQLNDNVMVISNVPSSLTTLYENRVVQITESGNDVSVIFPTPDGTGGTINFPQVGSGTKTVAYVEDISSGTQNLQSVLENGNVANGSITLWEDAEHLGNVANVASDIIAVGPGTLPDSAGITTGSLFFKSSQTGNPSVSLYSNTTTHSYTVDYPDKPEGSEQTAVFASDLASYQPVDSDLTDIAALSPPNDNLLQRKAGAWTSRTPTQVKSDLAISIGDVSGAQATLVSGTNIKTVNSTSILGSGNIAVEPTISTGTTSEYYRGDKSWQTLNSTAVGLGSVPNVDATNPANISQTSSYRFVTDTEKSTWNNTVKIIAKNTSNPSITGTTTETIFESYLVPGGTLSSVSTLQAFYRYRKTGTAGSSSIRIYINTTNSLSGATLIAFNSNGANLWVTLERTFSLSGGNLYGYPFGSTAISDVIGAGIALSSMSLNPANNFYIIITGQLGNSADTITLDLFKATN